jgi:large subunit ribosomal protein L6
MSRIGNKPIAVPEAITVSVEGRTVRVEGPKGKLAWRFRPEVSVTWEEAGRRIIVGRRDDQRLTRALHGTTRNLIANMVSGCLTGYEKKLEVYGVGYGVQVQGGKLLLNVGYASPRMLEIPDGLTVTVQTAQSRGDTEPARLAVSGADKQAVGELAARIRRSRPPEPYKGKGVRYVGEYVRRKVGKAFAGAGGATT